VGLIDLFTRVTSDERIFMACDSSEEMTTAATTFQNPVTLQPFTDPHMSLSKSKSLHERSLLALVKRAG
jgi:hypothetical protein